MWLDADNGKNRAEAVKILAQSEYVGADEKVHRRLDDRQVHLRARATRAPTPEFNLFFDQHASYPFYSDAIWFLTQMRRWGQIAEAKPDQWYLDTAKAVYRPDLYTRPRSCWSRTARPRQADFPGHDGFRAADRRLIDGIDLRRPQARRLPRQLRDRPEGRPDRHARRRQG